MVTVCGHCACHILPLCLLISTLLNVSISCLGDHYLNYLINHRKDFRGFTNQFNEVINFIDESSRNSITPFVL